MQWGGLEYSREIEATTYVRFRIQGGVEYKKYN